MQMSFSEGVQKLVTTSTNSTWHHVIDYDRFVYIFSLLINTLICVFLLPDFRRISYYAVQMFVKTCPFFLFDLVM